MYDIVVFKLKIYNQDFKCVESLNLKNFLLFFLSYIFCHNMNFIDWSG